MVLRVGYWAIRGLGAPLRMMCEFANVQYEADLMYEDGEDDWLVLKPVCIRYSSSQSVKPH